MIEDSHRRRRTAATHSRQQQQQPGAIKGAGSCVQLRAAAAAGAAGRPGPGRALERVGGRGQPRGEEREARVVLADLVVEPLGRRGVVDAQRGEELPAPGAGARELRAVREDAVVGGIGAAPPPARSGGSERRGVEALEKVRCRRGLGSRHTQQLLCLKKNGNKNARRSRQGAPRRQSWRSNIESRPAPPATRQLFPSEAPATFRAPTMPLPRASAGPPHCRGARRAAGEGLSNSSHQHR